MNIAAEEGNLETVKSLAEHRADVNFGGRYNTTPLYSALICHKWEIAKYLVQKGACIDIIDCFGWKRLLEYIDDTDEKGIDFLKWLVSNHAIVRSKHGWGPLHHAVAKGNLELVKWMVEEYKKVGKEDVNFAAISVKDMDGCKHIGGTPLHIAAMHGYCEIGEFLIEKGHAYVGYKDEEGKTPMIIAKENNHLGFAQMLINHGAKDEDPSSCLVM